MNDNFKESGKTSNKWLCPTQLETLATSRKPFIPAEHGNGYRENYYYGIGSAGPGYYSRETKDAYMICAIDFNKSREHTTALLDAGRNAPSVGADGRNY